MQGTTLRLQIIMSSGLSVNERCHYDLPIKSCMGGHRNQYKNKISIVDDLLVAIRLPCVIVLLPEFTVSAVTWMHMPH